MASSRSSNPEPANSRINSSVETFASSLGTNDSTLMSLRLRERPASRARIKSLRATSVPLRSSRGSGSV